MEDKLLPQPVGEIILSPSLLPPGQDDLCSRLDNLHSLYGLKAKPSDMFRGAIFIKRQEIRSNPDWVAQGAHSLREILYPFLGVRGKIKRMVTNKKEIFQKYGSARVSDELIKDMGRVWGLLSKLAHHGNVTKDNGSGIYTSNDFENLLAEFEKVMHDILTRQADIHKEIDSIILQGPEILETKN
jgi:hypothetical protein